MISKIVKLYQFKIKEI